MLSMPINSNSFETENQIILRDSAASESTTQPFSYEKLGF